jgi:hypothetical protein
MTVIYVPRVFGGTLILTITPLSTPLPTVFVIADFVDGNIQADFNDGNIQANFEGDV